MSKKALIIVDHGSKFNEANRMLEQIAELLTSRSNTDFQIISYCHMELAEPTIEQAFEDCASKGATDIVVHPYFLAPGRHSTLDIPSMVEKAAKNHPEISYIVTDPLGIHEKILDVVLERASISDSKK